MPIYEVQGPDGGIYEVEGPENATLEDLAAAFDGLQANLEEAPIQEFSAETLRGAPLTAAQGLTFGLADEAQAALAAPFISLGKTVMGEATSIPDAYQAGLEIARQQEQATRDYSPSLATGLEVAGAMTGAVAGTPANVAKGIVKYASKGIPQSLAATAGTGAATGGIYGFGIGEGGFEQRAREAVDTGLFGAVAGPVGAGFARAVAPLAKPFKSMSERMTQTMQKKYGKQLATQANQPLSTLKDGSAVALTKGQASQNPAAQSLEVMAQRGALGDDAQSMALAAQAEQQRQLRGVGEALGAEEFGEEALGEAAGQLRGAYSSIKNKVNKAYDDARIIQNVYVNKTPVSETLAPQVNAMLREMGADLSDFSDSGLDVVKQITSAPEFKDPKINGLNLEKMEFWRRRATNRANDAFKRGDNTEGRALKEIVNSYDDFMANLPEHALLSGDEAALEAINKARGLRAEQGRLFERNKVVEDIVKNKDLTNEELANLLLTGSKRSEKINTSSGELLKKMKNAVNDEEQFVNNLKKGVVSRVFDKSEGATLVDGQLKLEPNKLYKELSTLTRNKTFMDELFTEQEKNVMTALQEDLRKIRSVQPGADNYSNTAYALIRFFNNLPAGGLGLGSASKFIVEGAAEKGAKKELKENLAPVMGELFDELKGLPSYYGSVGGGIAVGE